MHQLAKSFEFPTSLQTARPVNADRFRICFPGEQLLAGSEWGNEPRAVGVPFLTLFESRLIHTISNLGANNV